MFFSDEIIKEYNRSIYAKIQHHNVICIIKLSSFANLTFK